jgi:hypothetical protein
MSDPYMPHGWLHALVRRTDDPDAETSYGAVVDELTAGAKVKVRWRDGETTWELKRDLAGWIE